LANYGSGNTTASVVIFPAYTSTWAAVQEVASVGSVIVDNPQFEVAKSFPTSPIITEGTSVTRTTDAGLYTWPIPTVVSTLLAATGTMLCLWTPQYGLSQFITGSDRGIISVSNSTTSLLLQLSASGNLSSYDGSTSTNADAFTYAKNKTYIVAVRWGYTDSGAKYQVGVCVDGTWTWGTQAAFDGAFTDAGTLYLGHTNTCPFHIKNIYFYPLLTQAQVEAMF